MLSVKIFADLSGEDISIRVESAHPYKIVKELLLAALETIESGDYERVDTSKESLN
jgi:hypothetical protein